MSERDPADLATIGDVRAMLTATLDAVNIRITELLRLQRRMMGDELGPKYARSRLRVITSPGNPRRTKRRAELRLAGRAS